MRALHLFSLLFLLRSSLGKLQALPERNVSTFATGFSEICKAVGSKSVAIFIARSARTRKINEFIQELHKLEVLSHVFNQNEDFFRFLDSRIKGSVDTTSLIFSRPDGMIDEINSRNLAHRLCLYMFYWGLRKIDEFQRQSLREPLRVVYITNPRKKVYRVYFNRNSSDGSGSMKMVNWFDANSLGLYREPLLPVTEDVYRKLSGRTLFVPAVHTPPWILVGFNDSASNFSGSFDAPDEDTGATYSSENDTFQVLGGRDDTLLRLIAARMEFTIKYVDPPERTQGSVIEGADGNLTFTGGIGMLQRREADIFLGDIPLSWERRQAVEFTFFTLADAGVFATHPPKNLNEALILIRPFTWDVWPVLLVTVVITAPAMYFIIIMPYIWRDKFRNFLLDKPLRRAPSDPESGEFHEEYLREITYGRRVERSALITYRGIPVGVFKEVTWFVVNLYLKQSVTFRFKGNRARFLAIVVWLGATYVLGDMYSAQLTSQLARPTKEAPINTLHRLEYAMRNKGYLLYVEKGSAAQSIIENGTGTFQRLFNLMKHQPKMLPNKPYEVDSIEQGMELIRDFGSRAILGGRGTIYFNTKKFGTNNFQISEKLYTRYSAIAVQNGCLFLESLNSILVSLFEAGILEKITTIEYEKTFGVQNAMSTTNQETAGATKASQSEPSSQKKPESSEKLTPITIRMIQGAFYMLFAGYFGAGVLLVLENVNERWLVCAKVRSQGQKRLHRARKRGKRALKRTRKTVFDTIHEAFAFKEHQT